MERQQGIILVQMFLFHLMEVAWLLELVLMMEVVHMLVIVVYLNLILLIGSN